MDTDTRYLIDRLIESLETGARFIRYYHTSPKELRAWAARIESNFAPTSDSLPARTLENAAAEARRFLSELPK